MRIVFWFRQDLRWLDNPGLQAAAQAASQLGARLEALYVATPAQWQAHDKSAIQADLLERRLNELGAQLAALGVPLRVHQVGYFAEVAEFMPAFLASTAADPVLGLYANRELPPDEIHRDAAVQQRLQALNVTCHWFDERCLLPPGSVLTGQREMFKVYTPFSRAWLRQVWQQGVSLSPTLTSQGPVCAWQPVHLDYPKKDSRSWPVAEAEVASLLQQFIQCRVRDYAEQRDRPAAAATSRLSAYLALGILSVRQCVAALQAELGYLPMDAAQPGFAWLNELIWREFYQHLLAAYPRLAMGRTFKAEWQQVPWMADESRFLAWCDGMTGYPLVDAAMRGLKQTGWMHNRLRMIVASFLTKDLQQPWWWGERYFMQQLIDGELAANNGGWQWSAGTGADASPWFRIFNPTTQSEKFDPEGQFIRHYLPELAAVPVAYIHAPQAWLAAHGLAHTYPAPLVDHAKARQITLAMFKSVAG